MLRILMILIALGVACVLYAALIERSWFALRRHVVPCLPPGAAPLTILHLSDPHYRKNLGRLRRFLRKLAALKPDLVVGTGDFLGDHISAEECAADLTAIQGRLGSIFVLGSNDYYKPVPKNPLRYFAKRTGPSEYKHGPSNEWEQLVAGLERGGWQLIANSNREIAGFEVAGLDDPHIYRHDLTFAPPRTSPGFRLAVVHSPEIAFELASRGFDLIVCGHTHGGQLRVPLVGALVTNAGSLPRKMARGLHRIDASWLHVTAGLGTSKYAPVRFFCRPEACLLELVPR